MWEDLGIIGFHVFLRCAMWVSLAFLNTDYSSGKSCKNWLAAPGRDFFWCLQTKTVQNPSLKKIRLSPTVFFASLPPMYAIHLHILALGKCSFFQIQFQTFVFLCCQLSILYHHKCFFLFDGNVMLVPVVATSSVARPPRVMECLKVVMTLLCASSRINIQHPWRKPASFLF